MSHELYNLTTTKTNKQTNKQKTRKTTTTKTTKPLTTFAEINHTWLPIGAKNKL